MTIDEAIEYERRKASLFSSVEEYHSQLAEWLEELKELREKAECARCVYNCRTVKGR